MAGRATYTKGHKLEKQLDNLHAAYKEAGHGIVRHTGLTAVYTSKGLRVRKSAPDFSGVLAPYGRAVWFDAKRTSKEVYTHAADRRHQLRWLWDYHQVGAVTFLLVAGDDCAWCLWPQESWAEDVPYSVEIAKLTDYHFNPIGTICPAWEFAMRDLLYIPDWYTVVCDRYGFIH